MMLLQEIDNVCVNEIDLSTMTVWHKEWGVCCECGNRGEVLMFRFREPHTNRLLLQTEQCKHCFMVESEEQGLTESTSVYWWPERNLQPA